MTLNVIILAGGQSKRFWPLEEKNLFQFFGVPLIAYQVKRYAYFLKQKGIKTHFVIVTNQLNHAEIKNALNSIAVKNYKLVVQKLEDQAGAVIEALHNTDLTHPALIVNSNDIFEEKLINTLLSKISHQKIVLSATPVTSYFPGGYLEIDKKTQNIIKIWEKPPATYVPNTLNLFRFVLDYFPNPAVLKDILYQDNKNDIRDYESAINLLLNNHPSEYLTYYESFTSLKYPWHVLDAMRLFLSNIKDNVIKTDDIDPTAQITGRVYIEEGVRIGAYSKLAGPVFIGKNTTIADYTLVRESHIGANCVIGGFTEVARSYIADAVMLHRNYIGDSVLSYGVHCGAGTVTANWRFDEKEIQSPIQDIITNTQRTKLGSIIGVKSNIGVGSCLMPGIKIGKNSLVAPNATIYKDLPEKSKS